MASVFRPALLAAALCLFATACDSVEERIAEHMESAETLMEAGEPEKAMLEYRNVLKLDQANVGAIVGIARGLEATGDLSGAVRHLMTAIEHDPNHAGARIKLAQAMLLAGELDRAREHADVAITQAPDNPDALAASAAVALRTGNTAGALEQANAALGIEPTHPGAGMILVAERLADSDMWEARQLTDRFLAANPDNLALNLVKLQILEKAAQNTADSSARRELGEHLEALIGIYPDEVPFRLALARFHQQNGDSAAAVETMRGLVELDPSNTERVLQLVRFLRETEGDDAARAELETRIAGAESAAAAMPYHLAAAELDRLAGDVDKAAARFDRLIAEENLDEARIARARMHLAAGELDQAGVQVDAVLEKDAQHVDALAIRATLQLEAEDADSAILTLRKALDVAPDRVELLRLSALAYEHAGNPSLALESLAAAVRLSDYRPDLALVYIRQLTGQKQIDAASSVLEEALRRHPDDRQLLTALADIRLNQGDWEAAERVAGQLARTKGENADVLAQRITAAVRTGQGRVGETIEILEGLASDPEAQASTMTELVRSYLRTGQTEEAQAFIDGLLEDNPENAAALILQAALRIQSQDFEAAEADIRRAIEAEPGNPRPHMTMVRFLFAQKRPEEARAALEDALTKVGPPQNFALKLTKAQLLEAEGDYDAAIALYEELFEERSDSIVVANNLAALLSDHRADDPASLERAVRVAKRLAGADLPQFQDTHGWTLYLSGDHAGALRSLIPAAQKLPDNPWVQYHIGMTYAALGEAEKAREHLERAAELGGEAFPVRDELDRALDGLDG